MLYYFIHVDTEMKEHVGVSHHENKGSKKMPTQRQKVTQPNPYTLVFVLPTDH